MRFAELARRALKTTTNNSPTILTTIGVVGTVTTAYLTAKSTLKAAEIMIEAEMDRQDLQDPEKMRRDEYTPREVFEFTWKCYVPPVVCGVVTIASIIGANRVGARRVAAMAAAYSLAEKGWEEYSGKIVEKMGERKEQAARDELQQERVDRASADPTVVIIESGGDKLCYESFSGVFFKSNIESLRRAQNDFNHALINNFYGHASLSEFYEMIGLPTSTMSDGVGWSTDKLLELRFTAVLEKGEPAIAFSYATDPQPDPHRAR